MTADVSAVDQRGSVHVADLLARAQREGWPTSSLTATSHTLRQVDPPTEPISLPGVDA